MKLTIVLMSGMKNVIWVCACQEGGWGDTFAFRTLKNEYILSLQYNMSSLWMKNIQR